MLWAPTKVSPENTKNSNNVLDIQLCMDIKSPNNVLIYTNIHNIWFRLDKYTKNFFAR